MTTSIYLFLFSLLAVVMWVSFNYWKNRKDIEHLVLGNGNGEIEQPLLNDNLADTKSLIFAFFDDIKVIIEKQLNFLFHWFLHFFVIILGFISDIFDYIYSLARDLFLRTATKEKEVVTKFWHHLKEYKREKDML
jgi:hypothetical protein